MVEECNICNRLSIHDYVMLLIYLRFKRIGVLSVCLRWLCKFEGELRNILQIFYKFTYFLICLKTAQVGKRAVVISQCQFSSYIEKYTGNPFAIL